jgi:hypothetical protein
MRILQGQQQPQISIDISTARDLLCTHCLHPYFRRALRLKHKSAIASETGQPMLIPVEVLLCERCDTEFDPEKAIDQSFKDVEKQPQSENSNSIVSTE